VPAELPASWTFDAVAPATARAYWRGTRAAMLALLAPPPLLLTAIVVGPLLGWRIAAWHAAFVLLIMIALVEFVALTIDHIPYTRPYPPGHAKLKSRWPLYLFGMLAVAYWPVQRELRAIGGGELELLGWTLAVCIALHLVGRRAGARWSVESRADRADDVYSPVAVLDISAVRAETLG
jgi:hypothetical protein